ncbi:hypothetical protein DFH28DRAFT_1174442, partial [Melampsora americana]
MSELAKNKVINFVIHLTPDINPYQATADYLTSFLMPCPLPSWSLHIQRVIVIAFIIMLLQSIHVLFVRSKSKKIYHIGLNDMGLIQLDRANHCGLCYFLYSIIGMIEIICEEVVRSGLIDRAWPDFILGIKFTLTVACAGVILWLSICHCALEKHRILAQRKTPVTEFLSNAATWALNIFLVAILVAPCVAIIFSFFRLTMEYRGIRQVVFPIIQIFRNKASNCSQVKCSVVEVIPQLLQLARSEHHIDSLVTYTRMGIDYYTFICGFLLLIYTPFLFSLYQSFNNQRRVVFSTKRQQEAIFANTLLEFTIILSLLVLSGGAKSLIRNGEFIMDPNFWLILRIGINISISILGNIALFLILYSLRKTNATSSNAPIVMPKL